MIQVQQDAVECAIRSLEERNAEHDVAAHIKRITIHNVKYNPTWQCAVGRNFVTHQTSLHVFIFFPQPAALLIKVLYSGFKSFMAMYFFFP
uniref:Dynein light chain n=1 Tax=Calidris pygmaea TaxID=425635 RepID=A0A8C3KPJ6_9CHAR